MSVEEEEARAEDEKLWPLDDEQVEAAARAFMRAYHGQDIWDSLVDDDMGITPRANSLRGMRAALSVLSPDPLTIDRAALAKVALKTYNEWASLSPLKQMSFGYPSLGELIADAVIAHLSAQSVEDEVEWEYLCRGDGYSRYVSTEADAEKWRKRGYSVSKRTPAIEAGPWIEVQS